MSPQRSESAPYELDHLFTDATLDQALVRCDVLTDPLVAELSDHAPIVADFALEP